MSQPQPRPRHTSVAAGIIIVGSALLVVGVGERLAGLGSLETREAVARFVRDADLGLSVESGLAAYRIWLMVLAACATTAAVLAWQAARRSHGARLALSVLAVPIFFGGVVADGFFSAMVAAAIAILWIGPSGAWYRGDVPPTREGTASAAATAAPATTPRQPPRHRPDAVVWACVLTWTFCALAIVVLAASVAVMALSPSLVFDQLDRSNPGLVGGDISRTELVHATYATGGFGIAWSITAVVLAIFAWRRAAGARTGLLVSAAATAVLAVVGAVTSLLMLVPGVVAVVTISLLNSAEVRAWYAAGSRPPPRGPMAP